MLKISRLAAMALALFATGVVSAAGKKPPSYQDWNGVWLNITGIYFSIPGALQPVPTVGPNAPPLKPEFDRKWRAGIAAAQAGEPVNDPGADCRWPGVPGINLSPMPTEFLIMPDKVLIFNEYMSQVRHIYMDGRKVPEDLEPSFNGFSTGHWEGDTLVVDTVGLRGDTTLEYSGVMHTEQMTVRERIRKIAPDLIENEITMTDPGAFTKPWVAKVQFRRQKPDFLILEFACTDNNRNGVGPDGSTYTLGPDGKPLTGPVK